jgi:regulatory protein
VLRAKGVDEDLIEQATAGIDRDAEIDAAREVARGKRRSLAGLAYPVAYRRLAGALARKGYGGSVVAQVTRETLAGGEDGDEVAPW